MRDLHKIYFTTSFFHTFSILDCPFWSCALAFIFSSSSNECSSIFDRRVQKDFLHSHVLHAQSHPIFVSKTFFINNHCDLLYLVLYIASFFVFFFSPLMLFVTRFFFFALIDIKHLNKLDCDWNCALLNLKNWKENKFTRSYRYCSGFLIIF